MNSGGNGGDSIHAIMADLSDGKITPDEAADRYVKSHGRPPAKPQFDQQERRLLYGYPIIEKDSE